MDVFQNHAEHMQIAATFTTGAVFGIFLTIGQAWSQTLHSMSEAVFRLMRPEQEVSDIVVDLLNAVITSIICILFLFLIVQCPKLVTCIRREEHTR